MIAEEGRAEEERVALIAHDLRAMLAPVMGHAQWLARRLRQQGLEREMRSAEAILESSRRMAEIAEGLTDMARREMGYSELRPEPVDLGDLIARIASHMQPPEGERIQLEIATGVVAPVDRRMIELVMVNLLTNALKYSPPHTPVLVRLGVDREHAVVSVANEGQQIADGDLSGLFERGRRAGTSGEAGGHGLGLYIVRLIIEAHRGRIRAESSAEQGTRFSFTLPDSRRIGGFTEHDYR